MAGGDGSYGPPPTPPSTPLVHRESRWRTSQYGDITKLREYAAKHEKLAARWQTRAARVNTRIEKLRHQSAVLREKAQAVLAPVPELEQEIAQYQRNIQSSTQRTAGIVVGSDVTTMQVRIRKLQQKIVNRQHKSRSLELRAAQRTQKTAELKVKVDLFLEKARLEEQEAQSYQSRADKLQMVTQAEVAERIQPGEQPPPPPPPPPGPYRSS
jgi:predicted  nucleic acid-binding Zn-ribbon protein